MKTSKVSNEKLWIIVILFALGMFAKWGFMALIGEIGSCSHGGHTDTYCNARYMFMSVYLWRQEVF